MYMLRNAIQQYELGSQQYQDDFLTTYNNAEALKDYLWEDPDSEIRLCQLKTIIHGRFIELQDEVYAIVVQYVQNHQSGSHERNTELHRTEVHNTRLTDYCDELLQYAIHKATTVFDELDIQEQQDFLTEFHDAETLLDKIWTHLSYNIRGEEVLIAETMLQELTDRREEIYQAVVANVVDRLS
jgi:hypothetical protein